MNENHTHTTQQMKHSRYSNVLKFQFSSITFLQKWLHFSCKRKLIHVTWLFSFHYTLSHGFSTKAFRIKQFSNKNINISTQRRTSVRAVETIPDSETNTTVSDEPPAVNFAFVHSVLLPDGTPDVHFRTACGGQKLRDIMLDSHMELYGPYSKPLSNCGGGGSCGTCLVEVIEGKELLSPRTDKEKEKLKRNPKNWRLACQTIVGKPNSTGLVVIQQLPEWKGHEWNYNKNPPA